MTVSTLLGVSCPTVHSGFQLHGSAEVLVLQHGKSSHTQGRKAVEWNEAFAILAKASPLIRELSSPGRKQL